MRNEVFGVARMLARIAFQACSFNQPHGHFELDAAVPETVAHPDEGAEGA